MISEDERARLLQEYLDGTLDAAGRERLADLLERDPEARSRLADQAETHHRLGALLGPSGSAFADRVAREIGFVEDGPRFARGVVQRLRRHGRRSGMWIVGASVAACLAIAYLVARPEGPPAEEAPAAVETAGPGATFLRGGREASAEEGLRLRPGDVLAAGPSGTTVFVLAGGGRIELGPGAEARLEAGPRVVLRHGMLAAAAGGATVALAAGAAEAEAAPGSLVLVEAGETPRVEVLAGEARVARSRDGRAVEVPEGHRVRVPASGAFEAAPRSRRELLLVVGEGPLEPGDAAVKALLEGWGYEVKAAPILSLAPFAAWEASAALLSSSVNFKEGIGLGILARVSRLRRAPAPLIVWEPRAYSELALTGLGAHRIDWAATRLQDRVEILLSEHPLAAGLSGTVRVTEAPGRVSWGNAGPGARRVASLAGEPGRAAIFAYERGAPLADGRPAPARRVGFFFFDESPARLTDEGRALFEAALRWCLSP